MLLAAGINLPMALAWHARLSTNYIRLIIGCVIPCAPPPQLRGKGLRGSATRTELLGFFGEALARVLHCSEARHDYAKV